MAQANLIDKEHKQYSETQLSRKSLKIKFFFIDTSMNGAKVIH